MRILVLLLLFLLVSAVGAHDTDDESGGIPFVVKTGKVEPYLIDEVGNGLYLIRGEKVVVSLAADYYLTEGIWASGRELGGLRSSV